MSLFQFLGTYMLGSTRRNLLYYEYQHVNSYWALNLRTWDKSETRVLAGVPETANDETRGIRDTISLMQGV